MRVALVHDDLVQWGGAERVLLGLSEIFPDAPIFTSVFDKTNKTLSRNFSSKKVVTSFLQQVPGWKKLYKAMLPFYPIAFEQFNFDGYNLVISNTTRFAKSIITKPETKHICYCHTAPRFLWHLSGEKSYGILETLLTKLRLYDQVSSRRVDYFIAGSNNAAQRIKKFYRYDSKVIYPFIDFQRFREVEPFDGGYFVTIGRPNKYKKFDLVKDVCSKLGVELKIISGNLSDQMVVSVIAGARALIIAAVEDFGLTSLEAQALGKPVIAFRKGGTLETVVENQTGIFFDDQSIAGLTSAIERFQGVKNWNRDMIIDHAEKFSKENFISSFSQVVASL